MSLLTNNAFKDVQSLKEILLMTFELLPDQLHFPQHVLHWAFKESELSH